MFCINERDQSVSAMPFDEKESRQKPKSNKIGKGKSKTAAKWGKTAKTPITTRDGFPERRAQINKTHTHIDVVTRICLVFTWWHLFCSCPECDATMSTCKSMFGRVNDSLACLMRVKQARIQHDVTGGANCSSAFDRSHILRDKHFPHIIRLLRGAVVHLRPPPSSDSLPEQGKHLQRRMERK